MRCGGGAAAGLRLFGVQLGAAAGGAASPALQPHKSYSVDCLNLQGSASAYAALVAAPLLLSSSPSSALLLSIDECSTGRATDGGGYLSDDGARAAGAQMPPGLKPRTNGDGYFGLFNSRYVQAHTAVVDGTDGRKKKTKIKFILKLNKQVQSNRKEVKKLSAIFIGAKKLIYSSVFRRSERNCTSSDPGTAPIYDDIERVFFKKGIKNKIRKRGAGGKNFEKWVGGRRGAGDLPPIQWAGRSPRASSRIFYLRRGPCRAGGGIPPIQRAGCCPEGHPALWSGGMSSPPI
jgi:hypothetical protein